MKATRTEWGAVGGIAFVALIAIAAIALNNSLDSHDERSEFVEYYSKFRGTSHEWREFLATFVVFFAAFCFAWFLRSLYRLVRTADDGLAVLSVGAGFLFLALLVAAFVASTAVGTTLAFSDGYVVDIDTAILMSDVALLLLTASAAGAAVMIWAVSLAARRAGFLPRWLVWGGFAVAVAGLAATVLDGIPHLLELAWIVAVSYVMTRRPRMNSAIAPRGTI